MKQIVFYLDESGTSNSNFFTVGGFWYIKETEPNKSGSTQSEKKLWKIGSELKSIEKAIKGTKKNFDKKTELKWVNLTDKDKSYLVSNIKNNGQNHISITVDMNEWKKHNGSTDCTYIYNYLVYIMIEWLFDLTNSFSEIFNEKPIKVILNCDERPTSPDSKHSLRDYLQWKFNEFYQKKQLKNPFNFSTNYRKSNLDPLIRYADYFVGLMNSVHKLQSGKGKTWDQKSILYYQMIHKIIPCFGCFMYPKQNVSFTYLPSVHWNVHPVI